MKKINLILFLILLIVSGKFQQLYAIPEYTLTASKNNNLSSADSIVIDIRMLHTNSASANFEYALGQYYFNFNTGIANGGTLTYIMIDSDLPVAARPRNPTISGNQLRLVTNAVLGAGNGPAISSTSPGTLIVRMSLRTSASSFAPGQNLNLEWRNISAGNPFTKVFAYVGVLNTEITNSANHFMENGLIPVNQISSSVPSEYSLAQNFPNPFNPETKISFTLPESGNVTLKVFDLSGKEIASIVNGKLSAGKYEFSFNGNGLSSGVYFYRISANQFNETKRMILVK
jgi:hypothetical protein